MLATGNTVSIDNIDNRRLTGKCCQDDITDEGDISEATIEPIVPGIN